MRAFIIVAIRLFAVFLIADGVMSFLPQLIALAVANNLAEPVEIPYVYLGTLFLFSAGIALALWLFAEKIAIRVAPEDGPVLGPGEERLVRAGTLLIGVFWLVRGAHVLIGQAIEVGSLNWGALLLVVLSILLILGAQAVGSVYQKLRAYDGSDV